MTRQLLGILAGISIFAASAMSVEAATLKRLHLDVPTMTGPGYTITKKGINLGIPGNVFSEGADVVIKSSDLAAPTGWEFLKGPLTYDIRVSDPQVTENPLWLSFNTQGYSTNKLVRVGFFNRISNSWVMIPTIRIPSGEFRSAIHFPYTTIALFEHETEKNIPKQLSPDPYLPDVMAAAVTDRASGNIIWEKNGDEVRSLASITKLMSALVVLHSNPEWDRVVEWKTEYDREGSALDISPGEHLTVRELWYTSLVGSANNATIALADTTGMTLDEFVSEMNNKATELGLEKTRFVEPTGLDPRNQSTAEEILVFASEAFRHMDILKGTTTRSFSFSTQEGNAHYIRNTNQLLYAPLYITGGKTGYIDESGYNLVMQTIGPEEQEILAVVLGTSTWQSRNSSEETLINWAYNAFQW